VTIGPRRSPADRGMIAYRNRSSVMR
jgi:hypothetical protein